MMRTLFALLMMIGAGGLFFMYTQPTYDGTKLLQAQIAEYDAALSKADELQRLKQQLLARFNAFNPNDIQRLNKMLPDHVDNVRLVLDLDSLAGKHGITLTNVTINSAGSGSVEETVVSTIGASRENYGSLTLKFGTQGTYDTFVAFMKDLEKSLRIVDVTSLSIDQLGVESAQPQFRYEISMNTYWLK